MKELIYFTDYLGDSRVDPQSSDKYKKVFELDGIIMRSELYESNTLSDIEYFLSDGENTNTVLEELSQKVDRFVILNRRKKYGNYTIVTSTQFRSKKAIFKSRELYTESNDLICVQDLDLISEKPILLGTEKFMVDLKGEDLARFDYDVNGKLRDLWGMIVYDARIFENPDKPSPMETITGIDAINKYFPDLIQGNPYYKDATFLPDQTAL